LSWINNENKGAVIQTLRAALIAKSAVIDRLQGDWSTMPRMKIPLTMSLSIIERYLRGLLSLSLSLSQLESQWCTWITVITSASLPKHSTHPFGLAGTGEMN